MIKASTSSWSSNVLLYRLLKRGPHGGVPRGRRLVAQCQPGLHHQAGQPRRRQRTWKETNATPTSPTWAKKLTRLGYATPHHQGPDQTRPTTWSLPHPAIFTATILGIAAAITRPPSKPCAPTAPRPPDFHIQFAPTAATLAAEEADFKTAELARSTSTPIRRSSADVGQVMFGKATGMTADARSAGCYATSAATNWVNADTEHESGCGIVPAPQLQRQKLRPPCSGASGWSCSC